MNPQPTNLATADQLPKRMKIMSWGQNEDGDTSAVVGWEAAQNLAANQKAIGRQRVAIDYENNTVEGSPAFEQSREPRPVAGYGTVNVVPDDGLYLEDITWTPGDEESARDYPFLKPAVYVNKNSRSLIAVHSVGLSKDGGIAEMHPDADSVLDGPPASYSAPIRVQIDQRPTALRPTVADLQRIGKASGLQLAIAAHREETAGQADYAGTGPLVRSYSSVAAARVKQLNPGLRGLDLAIAINNAENAGKFGYHQ